MTLDWSSRKLTNIIMDRDKIIELSNKYFSNTLTMEEAAGLLAEYAKENGKTISIEIEKEEEKLLEELKVALDEQVQTMLADKESSLEQQYVELVNRAKLELGIDSTEMPESVRKVVSEYEKKLRDNMPKE